MRWDPTTARFLAAEGCVAYALDLRGHGHTVGPDNLGQAGPTAWDDMTADIKQLADLARDENPRLPLIAFGHSMGSALTQSHIENHSDLLAGAILCGTLGAVPGADEDDYPGVIAQLQALRAGPWRLIQDIQSGNAESHPNLSAPSSSR